MSKMCEDCVVKYCAYEPHSEECQSTRSLKSEYVYFELNDWMPNRDYPDEEPYKTWVEMTKENNYYIPLRDENWIKENELVVCETLIDMALNFCITAKREWIEKNCPSLLTKYSEFIREDNDDGEIPYGRFGSPFLELNENNIGTHYFDLNESGEYEEIFEK